VEACGSSEEFVAGARDSSQGATESGRSKIHGPPSDVWDSLDGGSLGVRCKVLGVGRRPKTQDPRPNHGRSRSVHLPPINDDHGGIGIARVEGPVASIVPCVGSIKHGDLYGSSLILHIHIDQPEGAGAIPGSCDACSSGADMYRIRLTNLADAEVVEISFADNTQKTDTIILEVLGLQPSFQKTYAGSSFTERIPFVPPNKYGWEIHPVIILAENQDLGLIAIKTEIHEENEPEKPVIFSKQGDSYKNLLWKKEHDILDTYF